LLRDEIERLDTDAVETLLPEPGIKAVAR